MIGQTNGLLSAATLLLTCGLTVSAGDGVALTNPVNPADEAQGNVLAAIVEQEIAAVAGRAEPAPEHAATFAREVVDAASLFAAGDVASYREFLEERLIDQGVFSSQTNADAFWAEGQRTFLGLELSAENIVVRPWRLGEQVFAYQANHRTSAWRSEGRAPTLVPTPECPIEQYETLVTARLNDADTGTSFVARVGFILQHDCAQERWTIVGIAVYERPKGVRVVMPSF